MVEYDVQLQEEIGDVFLYIKHIFMHMSHIYIFQLAYELKKNDLILKLC